MCIPKAPKIPDAPPPVQEVKAPEINAFRKKRGQMGGLGAGTLLTDGGLGLMPGTGGSAQAGGGTLLGS